VDPERLARPSSATWDVPRTGDVARCVSCGGLLAPDADWCGQCFQPVVRPEPAAVPEPQAVPDESDPREDADAPDAPDAPEMLTRSATVAMPGGGGVEIAGGTASWDCPVCDARNPIEASACSVCGASFARLFQSPEEGRPSVDPKTAALWSLAFAGLGHWRAGLRAEGVARMILFAWTLGTVLVILVSSGGGFGAGWSLFGLYAISAIGIYVLSAVDAHRVAAGLDPLVPSRMLLWSSAVLILLSIVLATFVTIPAARG
jgi:ribosomal protein L40E